MLSSSLLVFAPGQIKLLLVDVLFTNAGVVTVVFAHKVPLSIAAANQELTRVHDGIRMAFSQISLLPSWNTFLGRRFSHTKLYQLRDFNLLALWAFDVVKRGALISCCVV